MRRPRPLVLVALLLLVAGCGDSPAGPPAGEGELVAVSRRVIVVDGDSGIALRGVEPGLLLLDVDPGARAPAIGDVLAGAAGGGFLLHVMDTAPSRGGLLVETEPAALVDALLSGSFSISRPAGFGGRGGGVDLAGLVLIEAEPGDDGPRLLIEEGFLSFDGRFDLSLGIAARRLAVLEATAAGLLGFSCRCAARGTAANASGNTTVAEIVSPFVASIGRLPVAGETVVALSIDWSLGNLTTAGCAVGIRADAPVPASATIRFRDGRWSGEGDRFFTGEEGIVECEGTTDGVVEVRAVLEVGCRLYGRPGPGLVLSPGFVLTTRAETPPVWFRELRGTFSAAAVAADVVGNEAPFFDGPIAREDRILVSGPFATDEYAHVGGWGGAGSAAGRFDAPRGIALGNGSVYVADTRNHRIQRFSTDGTYLGEWGSRGAGPGEFEFPGKLAVDKAGRVLVVDTGNGRVQIFDAGGGFLGLVGGPGTEDGEFLEPAGIAAGDDGRIYVTDAAAHRVLVFSAGGAFLFSWGLFGDGPGEIDTPLDIAVDGTRAFVAECRNHRVQAFTTGGDPLFSWGGAGNDPGLFDCPAGVAVDDTGRLFVVDYGNDRFQRFSQAGALETILGASGTGEGEFERPEGVAAGAFVFILDTGNDRVQVFAPR